MTKKYLSKQIVQISPILRAIIYTYDDRVDTYYQPKNADLEIIKVSVKFTKFKRVPKTDA